MKDIILHGLRSIATPTQQLLPPPLHHPPKRRRLRLLLLILIHSWPRHLPPLTTPPPLHLRPLRTPQLLHQRRHSLHQPTHQKNSLSRMRHPLRQIRMLASHLHQNHDQHTRTLSHTPWCRRNRNLLPHQHQGRSGSMRKTLIFRPYRKGLCCILWTLRPFHSPWQCHLLRLFQTTPVMGLSHCTHLHDHHLHHHLLLRLPSWTPFSSRQWTSIITACITQSKQPRATTIKSTSNRSGLSIRSNSRASHQNDLLHVQKNDTNLLRSNGTRLLNVIQQ